MLQQLEQTDTEYAFVKGLKGRPQQVDNLKLRQLAEDECHVSQLERSVMVMSYV